MAHSGPYIDSNPLARFPLPLALAVALSGGALPAQDRGRPSEEMRAFSTAVGNWLNAPASGAEAQTGQRESLQAIDRLVATKDRGDAAVDELVVLLRKADQPSASTIRLLFIVTAFADKRQDLSQHKSYRELVDATAGFLKSDNPLIKRNAAQAIGAIGGVAAAPYAESVAQDFRTVLQELRALPLAEQMKGKDGKPPAVFTAATQFTVALARFAAIEGGTALAPMGELLRSDEFDVKVRTFLLEGLTRAPRPSGSADVAFGNLYFEILADRKIPDELRVAIVQAAKGVVTGLRDRAVAKSLTKHELPFVKSTAQQWRDASRGMKELAEPCQQLQQAVAKLKS